MKKLFGVFIILVFSLMIVFAEEDTGLEARIQKAVASLLEQGYKKIDTIDAELVIWMPTIADTGNGNSMTESVGRLSEDLRDKIEDAAIGLKLWRVLPPLPPTRGGIKTSLKGKITKLAGGAEVRLTLETASEILASETLSITESELASRALPVLPSNRNSVAESTAQASMLSQVIEQMQQANNRAGITLEIWPALEDPQQRIFHDGDYLPISLQASEDCYVKVYHIWSDGNKKLMFPNTTERNNRLRANTARTVLNEPNSKYKLWEPFGEEIVYAVVSTKQFDGIEQELQTPKPVYATRESIGRDAKTERGGGLAGIVKNIFGKAEEPKDALAWFRFTLLPKDFIEDNWTFTKPSDMGTVLGELERDLKSRGGTLSGTESRGEFSVEDVLGTYSVAGDTVHIRVRHPYYQSILDRGGATRGGGGKVPFSFSFPKPADLPQAVQKAKTEIEKKGGTFFGDDKSGTFKVLGIKGEYTVPNEVMVSIAEKPFIVTIGAIEKGVPEFFGVK